MSTDRAARAAATDARAADASCQRSVRALLSRLPHYSQYSQARQEPLQPDDPVYAHLERGFVQRVTRHRGPKQGDPHREVPKLKVVRIEQIFSKRLQDKYLAAVQDEIGLCGTKPTSLEGTIEAIPVRSFDGIDMNEFLLYHGAPTGLIPRLVLQGLDPRNAGTHFGKLFGAGTYLASHSSKSDIYTKPNERGERCTLLVRACLGEPHTTKTQMNEVLKPPERPDKRGPLSSVVAATVDEGGCVEHPEFIVYKDSQTLPQFAIYYRHEEECKCTHCWREVEHITLKVKNEDGIEVYFKCKTTTPLQRLMMAYCSRLQGKSVDDVRFVFDGVQIEGAQTPAQLDMEDGDVRSSVEPLTRYISPSQVVCPCARQIIDVYSKRAKRQRSSSGHINLKAEDEHGDVIWFKCKTTTSLLKLMHAYCNRQGMSMNNVRFMFHGVWIKETQTPAGLDMEDGDVIEVHVVL